MEWHILINLSFCKHIHFEENNHHRNFAMSLLSSLEKKRGPAIEQTWIMHLSDNRKKDRPRAEQYTDRRFLEMLTIGYQKSVFEFNLNVQHN